MARTIKYFRLDDFSDRGFARLLAAFDLLHDFASDGHLVEATDLRPTEVIGWLEDILFTIEEAIREIDMHEAHRTRVVVPTLHKEKESSHISD